MSLKKITAAVAAAAMTVTAMATVASAANVYTWDFTKVTGVDTTPAEGESTKSFSMDAGATTWTYPASTLTADQTITITNINASDSVTPDGGFYPNGGRYINFKATNKGVLHIYAKKTQNRANIKVVNKGSKDNANNTDTIYYVDAENAVQNNTNPTLTGEWVDYYIPISDTYRHQINTTYGSNIQKIEYVEVETKSYTFDVEDWNSKTLYVEASKGNKTETKSVALSGTTHVEGSGSIALGVQITDVPADVTINSVYVQ